MDAQRALLDELMGAARNLTDEQKKGFREIRWDDKELFSLSFEQCPRHDSQIPIFEAELFQFCEKLVMDLDRKVKRGRDRLSQEVEIPTPSIPSEKSEQLSMLEDKIKKLLEQIETLGETGKVDEAEALMRKVDILNNQKTALTQQTSMDKVLMLTQEKKMALCEICGSFLVANDAAERTQSHVTGKQHIGYGMVRDFISEYKAAKEKIREEERIAREKEAEQRKKRREREEENKVPRSNDGGRERYSDRNRNRPRERENDRDRYRERNGWGNRDVGRGLDWNHSNYRNGRDWDRERDRNRYRVRNVDRVRDRSRSHSPARQNSYRRLSRSPV